MRCLRSGIGVGLIGWVTATGSNASDAALMNTLRFMPACLAAVSIVAKMETLTRSFTMAEGSCTMPQW